MEAAEQTLLDILTTSRIRFHGSAKSLHLQLLLLLALVDLHQWRITDPDFATQDTKMGWAAPFSPSEK